MLLALPGFGGNQSSLNPVGPAAAHIEHTFAVIFFITATVYCLVMAVLVISVWRRRHGLGDMPQPQPTSEASDRVASRAVGAAMAVTLLLLFTMLVSSFRTSRALGKMNGLTARTIEVYGHQWWWEVRYPNAEADHIVVTANEIHLPVGTPIRIHGTSRDVIHSFWAPNVQGKRDFLPGYDTDILMEVDRAGRWRGQCAEYCGEQHAHMSFYMVAEPQADFDKWLGAQAMSSADAGKRADSARAAGVSNSCLRNVS